jgi:hypothetical protein
MPHLFQRNLSLSFRTNDELRDKERRLYAEIPADPEKKSADIKIPSKRWREFHQGRMHPKTVTTHWRKS